mmetsp:Transcript_12707/g.30862  ORF Transcript_12707/g.30862 Transcript_12707/m.30862 type:complete len:265 (-) Transcript_12707:134-928(-)
MTTSGSTSNASDTTSRNPGAEKRSAVSVVWSSYAGTEASTRDAARVSCRDSKAAEPWSARTVGVEPAVSSAIAGLIAMDTVIAGSAPGTRWPYESTTVTIGWMEMPTPTAPGSCRRGCRAILSAALCPRHMKGSDSADITDPSRAVKVNMSVKPVPPPTMLRSPPIATPSFIIIMVAASPPPKVAPTGFIPNETETCPRASTSTTMPRRTCCCSPLATCSPGVQLPIPSTSSDPSESSTRTAGCCSSGSPAIDPHSGWLVMSSM